MSLLLHVLLTSSSCPPPHHASNSGSYVKDADKEIVAVIKEAGRLVEAGSLTHSYPFCWRSDTPLIYRAVPSWFVKVEEIKERLLHNNTVRAAGGEGGEGG